MKILLVGSGDTIFITSYAKALKKVLDVEVHVYSPYPRIGNYDSYPYDYVYFENNVKFSSRLLNKIAFLLIPFIFRKRFSSFLKKKNTRYDIIHFHRILPAWVLNIKGYRKYCKKLLLTFWGGELDVEHLFLSRKLYKHRLGALVSESDNVISAFSDSRYFQQYPILKEKGLFGVYGSSIVDEIYKIDKNKARKALDIPQDRVTILLGYSGKRIHNHTKILKKIVSDVKFGRYRHQLHFLVSMTRGGSEEYTCEIEKELKKTDANYTLIKGGYSSDKDVANLRVATDFVFQLSEFDGVSSSIKECLCAGSIVITGDWLPYSLLKDKGFLYPEVSNIEEGVKVFYQLLDDYPVCLDNYVVNKSLGRGEFSWNYCIKNWANTYKKVL